MKKNVSKENIWKNLLKKFKMKNSIIPINNHKDNDFN